MNLGTFKAFGLSKQKARGVYFQIIIRFLAACLLLAGITAFALGLLADAMLSAKFSVEQGVSYFNLLHPYTLIILGVIMVTALVTSWLTISKILSKSPGDLIYNR